MEDGEAEIPDITGVFIISQRIHSGKSLCPHLPSGSVCAFGDNLMLASPGWEKVAKILQQQLRQLPSARKIMVCIASGLLTLSLHLRLSSVDLDNPVKMPKKYWGIIPPPLPSWEEINAYAEGSETTDPLW